MLTAPSSEPAEAAHEPEGWMARVQACTQGGDWAGVIRACAGGLQQLPELGLEHHPALSEPYLSNLELGAATGGSAARPWPWGRPRARWWW